MSTVTLLTLTGLGLGALYFLVASGLSLIFGLMRVLNFAHGAFLTVGAYAGWALGEWLRGPDVSTTTFVVTLVVGAIAGAVFAALTELVLIRPLYRREIDQVLVTVGLALATGALVSGIAGSESQPVDAPGWLRQTTTVLGARVPNDRFVAIGLGVVVLTGLTLFLRRTRFGLVVRAGVENRDMVTALGVDVRSAFTLVFSIGGAAAGVGGALAGYYFGSVNPQLGTGLLIFAFIVVVIGGMGSVLGSAVAAVVVALIQQFANYYAASGVGNLAVVLLLAAVLLVRPAGLMGREH